VNDVHSVTYTTLTEHASSSKNDHRGGKFWRSIAAGDSEAAISILFGSEPETRAHLNEIDIKTLIPAAKLAQALAVEIFEIDPPTLLLRQVGCEIMLGSRWSFADACDVLSNFSR
jgi:hypothetical protein